MDRVDIGDRVRAAARDAGIQLEDPLGPLIEVLSDIPREIDERVVPLLVKMKDVLVEIKEVRASPPPVLTDKQVDDIGARLARGCDSWSAGLVKAANRRHYGLLLASLFSTALVGALASWLAFGKPLHPDCAVTPSGGRLCGEWVVPDKTR